MSVHDGPGCSKTTVQKLPTCDIPDSFPPSHKDAPILHQAVRLEQTPLVRQLLENGTDINSKDIEGNTPLHIAVSKRNVSLTTVLVNHGADVTIKNNKGNTPLNYAQLHFHDRYIENILERAKKRAFRLRNFNNHGDIGNSSLYTNKLHVRSFSSSIRAQLFETKLISLFFTRALNHEQIEHDFLIGTNLDGIGYMDDICLRCRVKGREKPIALFMQVRYIEDIEKGKITDQILWSDSRNFSLLKYFISYQKVKERFSVGNKDPMFQGEFSDVDCYFVIYTTAKNALSKINTETEASEIIHNLMNTHQYKTTFRYKYDESDLDRLTNWSLDLKNQITRDESLQILNPKVCNTQNAKDFFNKLWFYTGQAKHDIIEHILKTEINEHYNNENEASHLKSEINCETIFLKRHDKIQKWWMLQYYPYLTRTEDFLRDSKQTYFDDYRTKKATDSTLSPKSHNYEAAPGMERQHDVDTFRSTLLNEAEQRRSKGKSRENNDGHVDLSITLHQAVRSGCTSDVKLLLNNGADINAQDYQGNTPLHVAVSKRYITLTTLLVNHGADVTITNNEGNTPLTCALLLYHDKVMVNILERAENKAFRLRNFNNQGDICNSSLYTEHLHVSLRTSSIYAQLYETKVISLVFTRALNHEQIEHDFLFGTNLDGIGYMDDICLRCRVKGREKPIALFMQVIYKEDIEKGKITDQSLWSDTGNFSLLKYFISYQKVKERFRVCNKDPMFEGEFSDVDCYFVVYTTAKDALSKKNGQTEASKIIHNLLNTRQVYEKPFRYKYDKYDLDRLTDWATSFDLKNKKTKDESVPSRNPKKYNTQNAKDFFSNLWFYTGQAKHDRVEDLVKSEISKHYNSENEAIHFKFVTQLNEILLMSQDSIQKWWMLKGAVPYLSRTDDIIGNSKQACFDHYLTAVEAVNSAAATPQIMERQSEVEKFKSTSLNEAEQRRSKRKWRENNDGHVDLSTKLHQAIRSGRTSDVKLLLNNGADINAQDFQENTPLHVAVSKRYITLTTLLVDHGADVTIKNNEGNTPLTCALLLYHDKDVVNTLVVAEKKAKGFESQNSNVQDVVANSSLRINKTHVKSTDNSGLPGQLYETKLASLVFIRVLNHDEIEHDILFGTNIKGIGDMDDICLRCRVKSGPKPVVLFMQVKHKDSEKEKLTDRALWSDSGNFSLLKYFKSYLTIKERFRVGNEAPMFEGKFDDVDCYFVLYTTAEDTLTKKNTEKEPSKLIHDLINTQKVCKKPFQYKYDEFDLDRFINRDDDEPSLNPEKYNKENAKDFLNKLWFYSEQAKQDKVEDKVKSEISKHYNKENEAIQFKFVIHSNAIFLKSHDNIQKWWMLKDEAPFLTRSDDFFRNAKQSYLDDVCLFAINAVNSLKICLDVEFNQYSVNNTKSGMLNRILHRLFKIIDNENILITVDNNLKRKALNLLLSDKSQNAFSHDEISSYDRLNDQSILYSKRSGTSEICGVLFRTKLLCLVLLRTLHHQQIEQDPHPLHGSKISGIGAMNDICLRYQVTGEKKPVLVFMHLKHVGDPEKGCLTKESLWNESSEFNLKKHYASYIMIKERFQLDNKECMFEGNISDFDCYFGLYTTAKESLFQKKTENKMSEVVQGLINTRHDTEPFQYDYDEADINRLTNSRVMTEMEELGNFFLDCLRKPKKLNSNLLAHKLVAKYHVVMGREVLRPCDEQPDINKYRLWQLRSEFFNSNKEYLVTLKKKFCRNVISDKNREELETAKVKLPLSFGNLDMTFSENYTKAHKRMKTLADKLVYLLKLNKDKKIILINDCSVGADKTIQQDVLDINGGIGSAVGNLLIYDTVSEMLKFDTENDTLPPNAALVLRELKDDRHRPFDEDLSSYRIKVIIDGFPKISFEDDEYNKVQARVFLENFWFFCDQAKEDEIERILVQEMNKKYSNNQTRHNYSKCGNIADFVSLYSHDAIQKMWIQMRDPYLNRASEIFERAAIEDICNLLQTTINYMYLFDIYSINIKISQVDGDKARGHTLLEKISMKLFKLFNPEFNKSIFFSQEYLTCCQNFDETNIRLIIHPGMEWVALIFTGKIIGEKKRYHVMAKIDLTNRPKKRYVYNEYHTTPKKTRCRNCFKKEKVAPTKLNIT